MAKKKCKKKPLTMRRIKAAAMPEVWNDLMKDYAKWCRRKGLKP